MVKRISSYLLIWFLIFSFAFRPQSASAVVPLALVNPATVGAVVVASGVLAGAAAHYAPAAFQAGQVVIDNAGKFSRTLYQAEKIILSSGASYIVGRAEQLQLDVHSTSATVWSWISQHIGDLPTLGPIFTAAMSGNGATTYNDPTYGNHVMYDSTSSYSWANTTSSIRAYPVSSGLFSFNHGLGTQTGTTGAYYVKVTNDSGISMLWYVPGVSVNVGYSYGNSYPTQSGQLPAQGYYLQIERASSNYPIKGLIYVDRSNPSWAICTWTNQQVPGQYSITLDQNRVVPPPIPGTIDTNAFKTAVDAAPPASVASDIDKIIAANPSAVSGAQNWTASDSRQAAQTAQTAAARDAATAAQTAAAANPTDTNLQVAAAQAAAAADQAELAAQVAQAQAAEEAETPPPAVAITPPGAVAAAPAPLTLDFTPLHALKDQALSKWPFSLVPVLTGYFSCLIGTPQAPEFLVPMGAFHRPDIVISLSSLDDWAARIRAVMLLGMNGLCMYALVRRWS